MVFYRQRGTVKKMRGGGRREYWHDFRESGFFLIFTLGEGGNQNDALGPRVQEHFEFSLYLMK